VVYGDIKAQLVEVLKNKKDELKQTRIRTKELGREKSWLDWLGKYGDKLTLVKDLSKAWPASEQIFYKNCYTTSYAATHENLLGRVRFRGIAKKNPVEAP